MIYAVIDTNVLVSALLSPHPDAATVQVVSAISKSRFRPLYNKEILVEYREVLNRQKFTFPPQVERRCLSCDWQHEAFPQESHCGDAC